MVWLSVKNIILQKMFKFRDFLYFLFSFLKFEFVLQPLLSLCQHMTETKDNIEKGLRVTSRWLQSTKVYAKKRTQKKAYFNPFAIVLRRWRNNTICWILKAQLPHPVSACIFSIKNWPCLPIAIVFNQCVESFFLVCRRIFVPKYFHNCSY